jgi:uncharacterized protein (DUF302 family)
LPTDKEKRMPDMESWNLTDAPYILRKVLRDVDFHTAVLRVTAALKEEGFGVLTEIDVQATMKKKLDKDLPPYVILGACNPPLAFDTLQAEPGVGALLPCNVVVAQAESGSVVAAIRPRAMFAIVGRPEVEPIAAQVEEKLTRALDSLEG